MKILGKLFRTLGKYAEKDFRSVTQEDLGLSTDEEKKESALMVRKPIGLLQYVVCSAFGHICHQN